jgi:DNA-binding Lrp family transcriptional regulator
MTLEKILYENEKILIEELIERYHISFSELRTDVYTKLEAIMKKMFSATINHNKIALTEASKAVAHLNYHNHIPYLGHL